MKLTERGRIAVDAHFQTSVPGIYAIGDVIDGPMLAHKASEDGIACVETIAGQKGHVNWDLVPSIVYTQPEVAWVGKTEEQLKAAGVAYKIGKYPFTADPRSRANGATEGFVKVLADKATDKVLGVHIIGAEAGTMIAEAALAMEFARLGRGYRPRLPCPSDGQRGAEGSGAGRLGKADPSVGRHAQAADGAGDRRLPRHVGGRRLPADPAGLDLLRARPLPARHRVRDRPPVGDTARRRWPKLDGWIVKARDHKWAPRHLKEFEDLTDPTK